MRYHITSFQVSYFGGGLAGAVLPLHGGVSKRIPHGWSVITRGKHFELMPPTGGCNSITLAVTAFMGQMKPCAVTGAMDQIVQAMGVISQPNQENSGTVDIHDYVIIFSMEYYATKLRT